MMTKVVISKKVISFFLFLIVIFLLSSLMQSWLTGVVKENRVKGRLLESLRGNVGSAAKMDIVFLGNSVLGHSLDPNLFHELTKYQVYQAGSGGRKAAWWYLFMKNVVNYTKNVRYVGIFFIDDYLTYPVGTSSSHNQFYMRTLDSVSDGYEPIIEQMAFDARDHPIERYLNNNWSFYRHKRLLKNEWENLIQGSKFHLNGKNYQLKKVSEDVFSPDKMISSLYQNRINAESKKDVKINQREAYDFNKNIDKSYLPKIIELANKLGVQLFFVNFKIYRPVRDEYKSAYNAYYKHLEEYLKEKNLLYIDLRNDTRLQITDYKDYLHLKEDGKKKFTTFFAKELVQALENQEAK